RWMFGIAGAMAFVFGLSELKLIVFRLPFMAKVLPTSLQKSGDYSKSFFMGLFLGNAGVGCPNPAFYVLLTYIATAGTVSDGVLLGVVHGLGRATPLIFLVILAILGINTVDWVSRSQEKVERVMAWGLIGIGAYLFQYLPFKMAFWEGSIFHVVWNDIVTRMPWVLIGLMVGAVAIWDALLQRKKLTPHTIASGELRGKQNQVIQ
ncbi:MAG: hypothetical protein HYT40_02010, partial [Candidatus Sungbacteria bacterium]|nr:hypothetical protein [Candidatus Sungbacteria bacterium]